MPEKEASWRNSTRAIFRGYFTKFRLDILKIWKPCNAKCPGYGTEASITSQSRSDSHPAYGKTSGNVDTIKSQLLLFRVMQLSLMLAEGSINILYNLIGSPEIVFRVDTYKVRYTTPEKGTDFVGVPLLANFKDSLGGNISQPFEIVVRFGSESSHHMQ